MPPDARSSAPDAHSNRRRAFALALAVTLLGTTAVADDTATVLAPQGQIAGPTQIIRFVDGDTVRLIVNGAEENVRLIGIDTPETVHPTLGEQPFGREASAFTRSLLTGRELWVEFDVQERDHYGRPLVYLYFPASDGDWLIDGLHFRQANLEIIRHGWADISTIPPNVRYADLYLSASREARDEARGIWAIAQAQTGIAASLEPVTTTADRDCNDFRTQAEAQRFFDAAGPGDPHRLDGDRDAIACESLR